MNSKKDDTTAELIIVLGKLFGAILFIVAQTFILMTLWNNVLVDIFSNIPPISFAQSFFVYWLSNILFKNNLALYNLNKKS